MEAPTKGLFVGRDKGTERKLTLSSSSGTHLKSIRLQPAGIRVQNEVLRTTMLSSKSAVHTAFLECRVDRSVELSHE